MTWESSASSSACVTVLLLAGMGCAEQALNMVCEAAAKDFGYGPACIQIEFEGHQPSTHMGKPATHSPQDETVACAVPCPISQAKEQLIDRSTF